MIASTNRNLEEQRPVDTCPVQYGKQYGAKDSSKDKYKLADQHNIDFRCVGSLPPVDEVINRQRHGNETHHNTRDDEITQVRSRTYVVYHSKRDLRTQQMHHCTHTEQCEAMIADTIIIIIISCLCYSQVRSSITQQAVAQDSYDKPNKLSRRTAMKSHTRPVCNKGIAQFYLPPTHGP